MEATKKTTEQKNLDLLDELNFYYGGDVIQHLLKKNDIQMDINNIKMRKFLESVKLIKERTLK
jgi:hypothetical protein